MRILALDIETRPAIVYTWTLWQPTIGVEQIIDPGGMMCYTAKWLGERKRFFASDHHDGHTKMVQTLWNLLDEADAVLHFNGSSFDIPHINREFMEAGLTPPAPYKQIDLYRTVKRQARFLSNKLAFVAPQLGLDHKETTGGFSLWKACMAGDKKAWAKMKRYNVRDVMLLEDAYEVLRPWIINHPSHGAHTGTTACPRCGGIELERRGYTIQTTGKYPRLRCRGCGGWSRGTKREAATDVVAIT